MNNLIRWVLICAFSVVSPTLFALGLGGAEVKSYLDQPLDVRIELISRSSDELESVTAGLASAKDFELLGMSRAAITVPLSFELVTESPQPYIRITSDLKVTEPVVQVLVEVIWSSGRMLREYTLFLDPPTFESVAPPVQPSPQRETRPVSQTETSAAKVQRPVDSKPGMAEQQADTKQAATSPVSESEAESSTEQVSDADGWSGEEEVYGPVASGETLWGIARDFSRGSGYSVNQAMLALQRKNPEAFMRNNINNLKRGAILRLPSMQDMAELSGREAMLEVQRQHEEARTGIRTIAPDYSTPTVADSGDYQDSMAETVEPAKAEEDEGHLELVPPAEDVIAEDTALDEPTESGADADSIREQLSRTEEELVNARQENSYLTERIKELESQVEAQAQAQAQEETQADQALPVEDSDLASLETSLEEQRLDEQPEQPVAITPGGESQPLFSGINLLLLGAAVVFVVVVIWALWRRSARHRDNVANGPVAALAIEAEQILKTLRDGDEEKTVVQAKPQPGPKTVVEARPEPETAPEPKIPEPAPGVVDETGVDTTLDMEALEFPDADTTIKMEALGEELTDAADEDAQSVVQQSPPAAAGTVIDFADDTVDPEPEEPFAGEQADASMDAEDNNPEVKLDLARAYLSLGDKEASKTMLEEVLKTGNEAQVAEAKQMMEEL